MEPAPQASVGVAPAPLPEALRAARVFVAGHRGLVGSAVAAALAAGGARRLLTRPRADLDLEDAAAVRAFFAEAAPEMVVLCAARVGGILANDSRPAEFVRDNLVLEANVIHEAWRAGVRRLVFLGSSCIYPRDCPQPIRESYLLTGPLEPTNRAYAIAKIAGVEMCRAYNRQYGTRYLALMPSNCYGPGDNYDPESSHVLAALVRRFHEATVAGDAPVTVWGSGTPRREFLWSGDLAAAVVRVLGLDDATLDALLAAEALPLVNVGTGSDVTIAELVELVRGAVGHRGPVAWDRSRPDGTPRKLLDVSRMRALGWEARMPLAEGIARAYADYLERVA